MIKTVLLTLLTLLFLSGCQDKQKSRQEQKTSMKCGAGKCGANMFEGNSILEKKKSNILSQLREGDGRKACVLSAETTKVLYNCVRNPKTGKLSLKCGSGRPEPTMKCGSGKCGSSITVSSMFF